MIMGVVGLGGLVDMVAGYILWLSSFCGEEKRRDWGWDLNKYWIGRFLSVAETRCCACYVV